MREITKKVYTFSELSDEAKEKAREWYRVNFWETEMEDIQDEASNELREIFGIEVDNVYWSDPYSQGYYAYFNKGEIMDIWKVFKDALTGEEFRFLEDHHEDFSVYILANGKERFGGYKIGKFGGEIDYEILFNEIEDCELYNKLNDLLENIGNKIESYLDKTVGSWLQKYIRERSDEFFIIDEHVDETIVINEWEFYENGENYLK